MIDFGFATTEKDQLNTPYEPFDYRAPELLLGRRRYSHAIDMWSLGVILYELSTGKLPFEGETSTTILRSMMSILGQPPKEIVKNAANQRKLFGSNSRTMQEKESTKNEGSFTNLINV